MLFGGPLFGTGYVFRNTDLGYTFNTSLELQRTFENGLFVKLGYNFLDAQDASSIEAEISSDAFERNPSFGNVNKPILAPSLYGNRHRVVWFSLYKTFTYSDGKMGNFSFYLSSSTL